MDGTCFHPGSSQSAWGGGGDLMACTCLHGSGTCSPQLATSLSSKSPAALKFQMPCQIKVEHTSLTQLARAQKWQGWAIPAMIAIMLGIECKDKKWLSPHSGEDITIMTDAVCTEMDFHPLLYTLQGWVMEAGCFDQVWHQYHHQVWHLRLNVMHQHRVEYDSESTTTTPGHSDFDEPWHSVDDDVSDDFGDGHLWDEAG